MRILASIILIFQMVFAPLCYASGQVSINPEEIEKEIKDITNIELYFKALLSISESPVELENLEAKIDSLFKQILDIIQSSDNPSVKNYGLRKYLRVKKIFKAEVDSNKLLENNFILKCDDFHSCLVSISDLADLVDMDPKFSKRKLSDLKILLETITEKVSFKVNSSEVYSDSLLQRVMSFQVKSLQLLANYFIASENNNFQAGSINGITPEKVQEFQGQLESLDQEFYSILNLESRSWQSKNYYEKLKEKAVSKVSQMLLNDLRDFNLYLLEEEEIHFMAEEVLRSLKMTKLNNESLSLFIDRAQYRDFNKFESFIEEKISMGTITVETLYFSLFRFQELESHLPSRKLWLPILERYSNQLEKTDTAFYDSLLEAYKKRIEVVEGQLILKLDSIGMNETAGKLGETIKASLIENEYKLSQKYPLFRSLTYQLNTLEEKRSRLGVLVEQAKTEKENLSDKEKEKKQDRLYSAIDSFNRPWYYLACLGTDENHWVNTRLSRRDKVFYIKPVSSTSDVNLYDVCGRGETDSIKAIKYENSVNEYLYRVAIKRLWAPVIMEVGFQVLMLPVIVYSGMFTGKIVQKISTKVAAAGVAYVTAKQMGAVGSFLITKMSPKIISSIAGAFIFTAVLRVITSAITFNKIPIYEAKKSLWGNYGEELMYGSAIFFFLPYTAAYAHKLTLKYINPNGVALNSFKQQAGAIGIQAGMDTVVFTSFTYVERLVSNTLHDKDDEIFRGWGDLFENVGHSAMIALAFRVKGVHPSSQAH